MMKKPFTIKIVRAGDFVSVNSHEAKGHKGRIEKIKKTGEVRVITTTHSPYTRGRKNLRLQENPQEGDEKPAYAVNKTQRTDSGHLGKKHSDMKIKNPIDKSIFRHIKKHK